MDHPRDRMADFAIFSTLLIMGFLYICISNRQTFFPLQKFQSQPSTFYNMTIYRDELEEALAKASMEDRTVILTVVNKAYTEGDKPMLDLFLDGFWLGEDTRGLIQHLLVVAVDQTSFERCEFLKLHCYKLETQGKDFGGEQLYMSEDYIKMMWSRTLFLGDVLKRGYNFIFTNTAPRPDGKMVDAQAAALRIGGDKAAFYNCKFNGFQDTLCDDKGRHFFKDCYIEGTVDFIFGGGKSLYLNVETHVIPGDPMAMITAQARESEAHDLGYSFVHCTVTGGGAGTATLGRAWKQFAKVVFAYSDMSDVVNPKGWSDNGHPEYDKNLFFGEYNNKGPGADLSKRNGFVKKLTDEEAKPFITLAFIEASKWLLPPTTL